MQLTVSKQTAKALKQAIFFTIMACCDKGEHMKTEKFKPVEEHMELLGISLNDLFELKKLDDQIINKLNIKTKRNGKTN